MTKAQGTGIRARIPPHAGMVLAVVLVLLLTLGAIAPAAAAQSNETTNESESGNESVAELNEGPHTLEELRNGGREIPGADPSSRWLGETGSVFVDYDDANPLAPNPEDWEVQNVLGSGSTVNVDELTFNARRERGAPDKRYVLKVVSYDVEHVKVERGNETEMVPTAVNQRVKEHELQFSGAFDRKTINLRNTEGKNRQVAMWLETPSGDRVEGAQWTFEHKSTATSADAGISTMGDLFKWVGLYVLLPGFILIPASLTAANRILDKTGKGPMIPGVYYGGGLFFGLFVVMLFAWLKFATVLTTLPFLLGLSMVLLTFVGYLEYGGADTIRALFVREELTEAKSPSGEDVDDVLYQDIREQRLVRTDEDGTFVLVEKGLRPFLARLIGAAPTIDVAELQTQISLRGDKWDRMFVADPASDDVFEYHKPKIRFPLFSEADEDAEYRFGKFSRFRLKVPVGAGMGLFFGYTLGGPIIGLPGVGAAIGLMLGYGLTAGKIEDGDVEFVGAPVHMTQARHSLAAAQSEYADARTLESLQDIAWSERSRTAVDAMELSARRDQTVTEEMLASEIGIADAVETEEDDADPDEDVEDSEPETEDEEIDDEPTRQTRPETSALVPLDND